MWTSRVNKETDKIKGMAFPKLRCFHGFARYCYIEKRIKWFETPNATPAHSNIRNLSCTLQRRAPKSQHFSYIGMVMRSQLGVLDFNSCSGLEQARTKSGEKKCNLGFIKTWPSKWIKAKKDNFYLKEMVQETIEYVKHLCQFSF